MSFRSKGEGAPAPVMSSMRGDANAELLRFMQCVSPEQVLACPSLPSLPAVAMEVLSLTSKPNVNLDEIARVVQHDQALCARILKTVNSSFYGLSKPCPTITRAISFLGLSTVKSLVLGFSLVDSTRTGDDEFDLIDYWRRCIHSAAATRCIVMRHRVCDPEEAFIAALMQDVGMPAIHHAIGRDYQHIINHAQGDHNKLCAAELEALGFHHAEIGAKMGERWRLPVEMIECIRHHHTPESATSHQPMVYAVALGSLAAAAITETDRDAALPHYLLKAKDWFEIDNAIAQSLLDDVAREAKELSRLFRINISPGNPGPDINAMLAQAEEISMQHQLSVQRETEALRETNTALARQTITDALTGAGNRKQFDTELPALFAQAQATQGCLSIIMVDADKFKHLNDTFGHQAGDVVLMELARRMMMHVGSSGIVCRYGGEEFAVILPQCNRQSAARMAESIRLAIASRPIDASAEGSDSSLHLPVTVSVGVSALEPRIADRMTSPALLVRAADKALYAAKEAGRNCVRVFTMQPAIAKRS